MNKCSSSKPIILIDTQGNKSVAYMDESRMIIFTQYMTVEMAKCLGFKIEDIKNEQCNLIFLYGCSSYKSCFYSKSIDEDS